MTDHADLSEWRTRVLAESRRSHRPFRSAAVKLARELRARLMRPGGARESAPLLGRSAIAAMLRQMRGGQ